MRSFLIILSLIIFSSLSFAEENPGPSRQTRRSSSNYGLYLGGGYSTVADDGKGSEKLLGPAYGGVLGYRWDNWAIEVGYSKFDLASNGGVTTTLGQMIRIDKAEVKADVLDFMLKFHFFRIFMLGLGYSTVSGTHDFRFSEQDNPTNTFISQGESKYTGSVVQMGLVLPLFRFLDLRLIYEGRAWINKKAWESNAPVSEPLGGSMQQFTGQMVIYLN